MANSGSGTGALILSIVTRITLQHLGVKWSLVINGLISLTVLIPSIFLLRNRTHAGATSHPLKLSFLWHPGFVWVLLWGVFSSEYFASQIGKGPNL